MGAEARPKRIWCYWRVSTGLTGLLTRNMEPKSRSLSSSDIYAILALRENKPSSDERERSAVGYPMFLRRRSLTRISAVLLIPLGLYFYLKSSWYTTTDPSEIQENNVLDIVTGSGDLLDSRKHKFLQVRIGRDERPDTFSDVVSNGLLDYWTRFQKPL